MTERTHPDRPGAGTADLCEELTPRAVTVAVLGGGAGAGATTLLVALAVRAHAAGRRVTVVDADPCGGGLDIAFGVETEPGVRWEDLLGSDGPLDARRLLERLPARREGLHVLSFGREWCTVPPGLLHRGVVAAQAVSDLVLVDVGRGQPEEVGEVSPDAALLVARGSAAGLASAGATARRAAHDVRLVVRGMGRLAGREVAGAFEIDFAGAIPTDRRLEGDAERGLPAGSRGRTPFVRSCDRLLRDLLLPLEAAA